MSLNLAFPLKSNICLSSIPFLALSFSHALSSTNLPFGYRWNPADCQVDRGADDADDPEGPVVVHAIIAERDGENDSTKVPDGADQTGENA